jgi:hypothetical protein
MTPIALPISVRVPSAVFEPVYLPFQGCELVALDLIVIFRDLWVAMGWLHVGSLQGRLLTLTINQSSWAKLLAGYLFGLAIHK